MVCPRRVLCTPGRKLHDALLARLPGKGGVRPMSSEGEGSIEADGEAESSAATPERCDEANGGGGG